MKKRIVSTIMCLAMLLSMMSVNAFAAVSTELTVTVGTDGTISVKNADADYTGTALSYYIVEANQSSVISSWTDETTAEQVATAMGVSAVTTAPTLTVTDNGKFLVVVDIADGKVAAAGQSSAINISADDKSITDLTVAVNSTGAISVKNGSSDYTATGALNYYLVSETKATAIAAWTTDTTASEVATAMDVSAVTAAPTLTVTDNDKFLVVVDIAEGKVAAAGQSSAINISADDKSITDLTVAVNSTGAISVKNGSSDYTATGALNYYLVSETKATAIAAWTTDTTASEVATAMDVSAVTTAPTLTAADNDKFLVVVDIADGKVAAAGQSAAINVTGSETPAESVDITGSTAEGTYTGTVSSVTSGDIAGAADGLVTFAPTTNADDSAENVNVTLSAAAVNALVTGEVGASIQTSVGGIELPKTVLESITADADSNEVVVTIDKVDTAVTGSAFNKAGSTDAKLNVYDITVKVDGTAVAELGGNVKLKMAANANAAYLIYAKPAAGGEFTYEQVSGAVFADGFVTWTSNHLSTYGTTDKAGASAFITVSLGSAVAASDSIGPKVTVNEITNGNFVTVQVVSGDKVVALWSVAVTGTSYDFYVPAGAIVTVWETAEALAFGANGAITNTPVGTLNLTATVSAGE